MDIEVKSVEWMYSQSRSHSGPEQPPPVRTGIGAIRCHCVPDNQDFVATKARSHSPGTFLLAIGFVTITCPTGRHTDVFPTGSLITA